jgi:hypothetical protein
MAATIVKCDSCGAELNTKVEGGPEARYIAKQAGWHSVDGISADADGKDFCLKCKNAQAGISTEAQ